MTYRQPDDDVVAIFDAPPAPWVWPAPGGEALLLADYEAHPPIADLARPWLGLAGVRVDPDAECRRRLVKFTGFTVLGAAGSAPVAIGLPADAGARWGRPVWSPDGGRVAFTAQTDEGVEAWTADVTTGVARRVEGLRVLDSIAAVARLDGDAADPPAVGWSRDSASLFAAAAPVERPPKPMRPSSPVGPRVEETEGKQAQVATFQDLLQDGYDDDAFAYYATSQLVRVDVASGSVTTIGPSAMWSSAVESPDGRFLLVQRVLAPFSHYVPYAWFARRVEVRNAQDGDLVALVADLGVSDEVPRQGVPTGPRAVAWAENAAATLVWIEALDGGDPVTQVPHRDRLMSWAAPFVGEADEAVRVTERIVGRAWLPATGQLLLTEHDRNRRWRTTHHLDLAEPAAARVIWDRSVNDAYADPGDPLVRIGRDGRHLVREDNGWLWLRGAGASELGARPFLDRFHLASGRTERVHHSPPDGYEVVVAMTAGGDLVVRREAPDAPPNYVVRSGGAERTLTDFTDPHPEFTRVHRQLIRYQRPDGVALSGTLFLPPGRLIGDGGPRLPLLLWAYPMDYSDPDTAGQVRGSDRIFARLSGSSPLWVLLRGWAVLLDATMPVVGDPERMNDTYVEQITSAARAAIDALDDLGVIDRYRVVASGHSYGGFMTANLLAHTDLFAAGVARSGAYNRTLTPFGFQTERRSLWEVPEVYQRVSPFHHADRITAPILLVHGAEDNNSGTFPIQSERLFQAIQGLGGTARLVVLPAEGHGYVGRESNLHVIAETFAWIDVHAASERNRTTAHKQDKAATTEQINLASA